MANVTKGIKGFVGRPWPVRYAERVDVRGPNECWLWTGATSGPGYGTLYRDGKNVRATHLAWELRHSTKVPKGLMVCHKCDNPPCVNPDHLFVGTMSDNIRDAVAKGRVKPPDGHRNYTHCHKGHPLFKRPNGKQVCLTCKRARETVQRRERREARAALAREA